MSLLNNISTMQGRDFHNKFVSPQSCDRDRFYRVAIFSKDVVSGNWSDGYYAVNIDDIPFPNKYHLAVESWVMNSATVPTKPVPFLVEFQDINQADTYSTSSKSHSRIALLAQTSASWGGIQNSINSSTIGIPLNDTNILKSKQLRIMLKALDDTSGTLYTALGAGTTWVMTLLLYPFNP
jgi:hypothetical protein